MNQTKVFEWKQVSWMVTRFLNEIIENQIIEQVLRLLDKMKYSWTNIQLLNELVTIIEPKTSYWINMLLLHKHSAIGYKIEIFEWIKIIVECTVYSR